MYESNYIPKQFTSRTALYIYIREFLECSFDNSDDNKVYRTRVFLRCREKFRVQFVAKLSPQQCSGGFKT